MSSPPLTDWPVCVSKTQVSTQRGPLAGLQVGDSPTVLLVPGFTGSKEDFLPLLPELDDLGVSAIAIDLLGQYQSLGTDDPSEYERDKLAEDVRQVATEFASPPHLVGHSMGGLISRSAVISAPDEFASLTLMCSGPAAIPAENQTMLRALREALHGMTLDQIWQAKQQLEQAAGVEQPDEQTQELLRTRWVENNPFAMAAMVEVLLTEPDRVAALKTATEAGPKILVCYGEHDLENWPAALQSQMADRLSAANVSIPNAAHSPAVENAPETARVLTEFWGAT